MSAKYPNIEYIHYFTDGAPSHFKNRYAMTTVANHKQLFGYECSYHFSCSGHGKGEVDGLGSVVKNGCKFKSWRSHDKNPVKSVNEMVDYINGYDICGERNFPSVTGMLVTDTEIQAAKLEFSEPSAAASAIHGIREMHSFSTIEGNNHQLQSKIYSTSTNSKIVKVMQVNLDCNESSDKC